MTQPINDEETLLNDLKLTLKYLTHGDELFVRIYDKDNMPMRGKLVFAHKYIVGKSNTQIAETFSFLAYANIAMCVVVVPEGSEVKCWSPPEIDEPFLYEIDLGKPVQFIDDRLLTHS